MGNSPINSSYTKSKKKHPHTHTHSRTHSGNPFLIFGQYTWPKWHLEFYYYAETSAITTITRTNWHHLQGESEKTWVLKCWRGCGAVACADSRQWQPPLVPLSFYENRINFVAYLIRANPFCLCAHDYPRTWGNFLHLANSWNVTLESFKVRPSPLPTSPCLPRLVNSFSCCSFHSFASVGAFCINNAAAHMYACMCVCVCTYVSVTLPWLPLLLSSIELACVCNEHRIKY